MQPTAHNTEKKKIKTTTTKIPCAFEEIQCLPYILP